MMTKETVQGLLSNLESDWIERTISIRDDKLGPAVCAFANDFPNHRHAGYILLGVHDDGSLAGCKWTDRQLQEIGNIKSNGKVLPQPSLVVSPVYEFAGGEVVVVEVQVSSYPPVRFDGRCWIRVGPRRSRATLEEERILVERRASFAKTYDLIPVFNASIKALNVELFQISYLPKAIDEETLKENGRTIEEQLASLRFYDLKAQCPTNAAVLLFAYEPEYYLPGAYIQYVKFSGEDMISEVEYEKKFSSPLVLGLGSVANFIESNIIKEKRIRGASFQEKIVANYPYWALRELVMNAIMHRTYESNAPIYIYEFSNRIEIVNPGGLYGEVNTQNFPHASDYRNVVLAEAMKILGYVNRFNYGIKRAQEELLKNGNGEAIFDLSLGTKFKVSIYKYPAF